MDGDRETRFPACPWTLRLQAEFISKIIPDPIETGVVDALRRIVTPLARGLSA